MYISSHLFSKTVSSIISTRYPLVSTAAAYRAACLSKDMVIAAVDGSLLPGEECETSAPRMQVSVDYP